MDTDTITSAVLLCPEAQSNANGIRFTTRNSGDGGSRPEKLMWLDPRSRRDKQITIHLSKLLSHKTTQNSQNGWNCNKLFHHPSCTCLHAAFLCHKTTGPSLLLIAIHRLNYSVNNTQRYTDIFTSLPDNSPTQRLDFNTLIASLLFFLQNFHCSLWLLRYESHRVVQLQYSTAYSLWGIYVQAINIMKGSSVWTPRMKDNFMNSIVDVKNL